MGLIIVDEDLCLNYNYKKTECHHCRDVCPRKCWDDAGRIDSERCDGCGLCQSVCPVDAIGVEGISPAAWDGLIRRSEQEIHFSCRRFGAGPWSCLGFLNARDLVALTFPVNGKSFRTVFLFTAHCQECRPAVASRLEQEIAAANCFLARFGSDRVFRADKPQMPRSETESMNRRSFFGSLLGTGIETARNIIWPEDGAAPLPKAHWRAQVLRGRETGNPEELQDVFPNLTISQNCMACGLCVKICPVQAVTAVEDENRMELWHEPLLCTGCGLCAAHCPVNCVEKHPGGRASKHLLAVQAFPRCNECGKSFKPAGEQLTCFDCLLKGRQSIFGP